MEWAPLTRVRASGLIGACAYLLSVPEHRMAAATVLRELSTRKQLQVRKSIAFLTSPAHFLGSSAHIGKTLLEKTFLAPRNGSGWTSL